jgi:hypothetical protein
MICKVCQDLLYGHKGRRDSASQLSLTFSHHESEENLREAAEAAECYICRIICEKLERLGEPGPSEVPMSRFTSATLQRFPRPAEAYRLDVRLERSEAVIASFVLKQNGMYLMKYLWLWLILRRGRLPGLNPTRGQPHKHQYK